MIYLLEGPDGVGKTTLAQAITEKTKGHMLHCTWQKEWGMKKYFMDILAQARELNKYQDVVIDRWAPSEFVYGEAFRGGASFDVMDFLWENEDNLKDVKWIICENDNAAENHVKNKAVREEMFEDIAKVIDGYDNFVVETTELNWIHYNYDNVDMKKFVEDLVDVRR